MIFGHLNYVTDPSDRGKRIFVYTSEAVARAMAEKLEAENIPHVLAPAPNNSGAWKITVAKAQFDAAFAVNAEVMSTRRGKVIPDPWLRRFLLAFLGISLGLALIGALLDGRNTAKPTMQDSTATDQVPPPSLDTLGARMTRFGFAPVSSFHPHILSEVKYSSTDNFSGANHYGHLQEAFLHPDAGQALAQVQKALEEKHPNFRLIVYDGARPRHVQFALYEALLNMPGVEPKYVSNPTIGSVHNYGLAVDLSIVNAEGEPLDMGTPYDFFGETAHIDREDSLLQVGLLTQAHLNNRRLLRQLMRNAGFKTIDHEWWHFNLYGRDEAQRRGYQMLP
jgi:D-alanyl-D-alanine dipeptidase